MLICPTDVTAGRHSLTSDGSAERPLIGSGVSPHVCDITVMEHGMVKTSRQWNKRFADARWRSLQKKHIVRRCSLKKCESANVALALSSGRAIRLLCNQRGWVEPVSRKCRLPPSWDQWEGAFFAFHQERRLLFFRKFLLNISLDPRINNLMEMCY